MQTTPECPEPALRHRFDVDDSYRKAEAGILSAQAGVELIEGEIVDTALIGGRAGRTTDGLTSSAAGRAGPLAVWGSFGLDIHHEPRLDLSCGSPICRLSTNHPTAARW